ncbi:MAG: tetratricopeptide repeat protein [Acidobacteria bacterium]|nr:tetratricopeptide repeat protein [Acidobacteriota bacterium]
MIKSFYINIIVFISLFIYLFSPNVLAKDKWINLQSKNFNVVSNADEKKTKELILKMEQFRYTLSQIYVDIPESEPVPVTVVIFKDDKSFNPFKPLYKGKRRDDVAGYFEANEDENIIAIDASSDEVLRVIFHEYFHLLLSYRANELPLWINEGLAELYSSFEIDKNEVVLGDPLPYHVNYLQNNGLKFIPLKNLIQADYNSPIYNESDKNNFFYTQSWATMHYLMLSERGARKTQVSKYLKAVANGKSAEEAFKEVFGSFEEMDLAIRNYVGNKYYQIVKYPLATSISDKNFTIEPINEAQTQYYLGNLLLRIGRFEEAEKYFQQAISLDSSLVNGFEGLAFAALKRSNLSQAKEYFKQAITRGSKNYLVYYQYAETLFSSITKDENNKNLSPELVNEIIVNARKAVELRLICAAAYNVIALTQLISGENYQQGIEAAKQAVLFAPKKQRFAITLAQLQLRINDLVGAKKTLQPLLNSKDEEVKDIANQIMKQVNEQNTMK